MFYYIGPWKIVDGKYRPPEGTISCLDLRSNIDQANLNGDGYGLFVTTKSLDSDYELLSSSDFRSARTATQHQNIFESLLGYRPDGDMVSDLIFDILTRGSHPDGLAGVKTLMSANNIMDLNMINIGRVKRRGVKPNGSDFNRIRDVRREDYRKIRQADGGNNAHLKFLAMLGQEFNIRNPEDQFIPIDLPRERPVRPSTTLNESFPTDGGTLTTGQDQTWDSDAGKATVISSQLSSDSGAINVGNGGIFTISTNLSYDNMFTRMNIIALDRSGGGSGNNSVAGCIIRYTGTGPDFYVASIEQEPTTPGSDVLYSFEKIVGGVTTIIIAETDFTGTKTGMKRLECVASTFCFHDQENSEIFSTTDTSLTGNLQGGVWMNADNTQDAGDIVLDDVTVSDERLIFFCGRLNASGYLSVKGDNKFKTIKLIDLS